MAQEIKNHFDEAWERIKQETPLRILTELSEITGITQGGLSNARRRGDFSANWAYLVGQKYGLLTEWIMTGKGPKKIDQCDEKFLFFEELMQWAKITGGSENINWLFNQIENFYPMFKEWRKRREEGEEVRSEFPSSRVA